MKRASISLSAIAPSRWELFQDRAWSTFGKQIATEKLLRPLRAGQKKFEASAIGSLLADSKLEGLVRMARSAEFPLCEIAKCALETLDEERFASFVKAVGVWLDDGAKPRPVHDRLDKIILMLSDGFDILRSANPQTLDGLKLFPPLLRWTGPAAREVLAWVSRTPGLTCETYRQRLARLRLHRESPAF